MGLCNHDIGFTIWNAYHRWQVFIPVAIYPVRRVKILHVDELDPLLNNSFILYILSLFWPIRWQYLRNVMGRITMAMHKTKFLAWDLLTCNRTIRIIATTDVAIHVWFHPERSQSTMIISWEAFSRGKKTSQSPLLLGPVFEVWGS